MGTTNNPAKTLADSMGFVYNLLMNKFDLQRIDERAKSLFAIDNPAEDWGVVDECVRNSFRHYAARTLRAMEELAEETRRLGLG